MSTRFRNREDAGKQLAERLVRFANRPNLIVLALPRGGVPVGFQIAKRLDAPLDVFCVRKLGLPGHEEFAIGAIASGGAQVLNGETVEPLKISDTTIETIAARERVELERRERLYRGNEGPIELRGRSVIMVDDGIATGATVRAAISAIRQQEPLCLIVAAPVASPSIVRGIRQEVDDAVFVIAPEHFASVGEWYEDFEPTTDQEVRDLLAKARELHKRAFLKSWQ